MSPSWCLFFLILFTIKMDPALLRGPRLALPLIPHHCQEAFRKGFVFCGGKSPCELDPTALSIGDSPSPAPNLSLPLLGVPAGGTLLQGPEAPAPPTPTPPFQPATVEPFTHLGLVFSPDKPESKELPPLPQGFCTSSETDINMH